MLINMHCFKYTFEAELSSD